MPTIQPDDREGQGLADVGEMVGPLIHEINNFLNNILLNVAVMEPDVGIESQGELEAIRRASADMADLLRQFQEYRRRVLSVGLEADLNAAVRNALKTLGVPGSEGLDSLPKKLLTGEGEEEVRLTVALADGLPSVVGSAAVLERMCLFLVTNAARAAGISQGTVAVRTEVLRGDVLLVVEDDGPGGPAADLEKLFHLIPTRRPGRNVLELAACKSLVDRMGGKIQAGPPAEGGVAIRVQLKRSGDPLALRETSTGRGGS